MTALAALDELGALTGDATGGYRADEEAGRVVAGGRPAAAPCGARQPARCCPGAPTWPRSPPGSSGRVGSPRPRRTPTTALREVLRDGDLAFRHWRDGWIDDAGITWRRLTGLGYRLRHSAGRRDWPLPADHPAAPVRFATGVRDLVVARWRHAVVPGQQRRRLRRCCGRPTAPTGCTTGRLRAGELLADQRVDGRCRTRRPSCCTPPRTVQVEAHAALAEARENAAARLDAVGSYPHQIDRTLRAASAARQYAPGADPFPPTAEYWLREIAKELDAFRGRLDRLPPGSGARRGAGQGQAGPGALRHRPRVRVAQTKLYRTDRRLERSWRPRGSRPRTCAPSTRTCSTPSTLPDPAFSPVIPHHERLEHPYGDEVRGGQTLAAATRRGRGNRTNQDAATLVDAAGRRPGRRRGRRRVQLPRLEAGRQPVRPRVPRRDHPHRPGRPHPHTGPARRPRRRHRRRSSSTTPRRPGTGPSPTLAAYYGTDGTITIIHVGTARAYYLKRDATTPARRAADHRRQPGRIPHRGRDHDPLGGRRLPARTHHHHAPAHRAGAAGARDRRPLALHARAGGPRQEARRRRLHRRHHGRHPARRRGRRRPRQPEGRRRRHRRRRPRRPHGRRAAEHDRPPRACGSGHRGRPERTGRHLALE